MRRAGLFASEEQEQGAVIGWAAVQLPLWGLPPRALLAVPNGAHLGSLIPGTNDAAARKRRVARLRKMGMLDGAADLFLAVARGGFHGLWVEMKKRRESFSSQAAAERAWTAEQRLFCDMMRSQGYAYQLCYGSDEARAAITEYVLQT